tara:strand:+ start:56 stop:157 length:102 start_codon:yes stop_codon:yes gene_type:complete
MKNPPPPPNLRRGKKGGYDGYGAKPVKGLAFSA